MVRQEDVGKEEQGFSRVLNRSRGGVQGNVASWEKESNLMCYSEHAGKAEQLDVLFWVQVRGAVLLGAGCSAFRSCVE